MRHSGPESVSFIYPLSMESRLRRLVEALGGKPISTRKLKKPSASCSTGWSTGFRRQNRC